MITVRHARHARASNGVNRHLPPRNANETPSNDHETPSNGHQNHAKRHRKNLSRCKIPPFLFHPETANCHHPSYFFIRLIFSSAHFHICTSAHQSSAHLHIRNRTSEIEHPKSEIKQGRFPPLVETGAACFAHTARGLRRSLR
jgi:hypothetical protein